MMALHISVPDNHLTLVAILKLLEMIGLVHLYPRLLDHDRSPLGHEPDCRLGWSYEYEKNLCMHATVCLLHAGQPKRAGDVAKSGEFIGEFSWVKYDPIAIEG